MTLSETVLEQWFSNMFKPRAIRTSILYNLLYRKTIPKSVIIYRLSNTGQNGSVQLETTAATVLTVSLLPKYSQS